MDMDPHPPESSTEGPEETGFLCEWTEVHILQKSPQQVLRRPVPVPVADAPRPPESPTADPEQAELLSVQEAG